MTTPAKTRAGKPEPEPSSCEPILPMGMGGMLGTIFYAIGCFGVAMVLSSLIIMTRSTHARDEGKPWKTFIVTFVFCLAAPYGYCEALTRMYGKPMEGAIKRAYAAANFTGAMRYYRVVSYHTNTARALLVGTDKEEWGGVETPVVSVTLSKRDDGTWKSESYRIVTSGRLNQDGFVFPPYY